jgi:threonine aldolase
LCHNNLKFHLDGAHIWNALVVKKQDPKEFDNCLIPFPFVCQRAWCNRFCLLADKATIHRALRIRKILGEVCVKWDIAAAGIYALDHNVERLAEDHRRAKELANVLAKLVGFLRLSLLKLIF